MTEVTKHDIEHLRRQRIKSHESESSAKSSDDEAVAPAENHRVTEVRMRRQHQRAPQNVQKTRASIYLFHNDDLTDHTSAI